MIAFFLERRVLTNLITLFIVAVGGWQSLTVRREAFPDIKFDIVTINTALPGASPEEVETLVTRKVEEQLKGLAGVDRVESWSLENNSLIVLRIQEDLSEREKDRVVNDVYQAASRTEDLPELADKPIVQELTSDRPLITLSAAGGSEEDRDAFAEELKDMLEDIDGVSRVDALGERDREILVEADREKLVRAGITTGELAAALKGRNVDRTAGAVQAGTLEHWVRVRGAVFAADEVSSVVVRSNDERGAVRVGDVARVRERFEEERLRYRAGGKPAIELRVLKHKAGDVIKLADAVKELAREQSARAAGKGIELVVSDDVSYFVKRRLRVMVGNMIQGGFLVMAALFLFLDWRLAAVAAWGVPISFAAAMLVAVPLGFTINLMSLLAFIIVLGMLDDDSVVVAENIYKHLEAGKKPFAAAVDGAREVAMPVIGSVLVSSCAFLPFAMMSGIMGKFLVAIPLIVVMAFAASVFEAFFILPSHVVDLLPYGKPVSEGEGPRWFKAVEARYRRAIAWVLGHRLRFAGLAAGVLAATVVLGFLRLKFVLFPPGLIEQFFIEVEMPPGTNLDASERALRHVEEAVLKLPKEELDAVTGAVGLKGIEETQRFGTHYAQVRVFLTPEEGRRRKTKEIVEALRAAIGTPPGADRVVCEELHPGPPVGRAVVARLRGRDPGILRGLAQEARSVLAGIEGVVDVKDSLEDGKLQWRIVPNPLEAAFAALDAERISRDVFFAVDGIEATEIHRPDEEVKVRVRLLDSQRSKKQELLAIDVLNPQGRRVRLSRVAGIEEAMGPPFLQRYNFKPAYTISADVDLAKITSREANARLKKAFADLSERHPGYELILGGEEEETNKSMASLFRSFGVALLLDFVILATLFRSYIQPFIILLTIPIGLLGVTYALILHGQPASFMALLGVVAMSGVVLNNAIVLVNFMNEKRAAGRTASEAAAEAGAERLRAIGASSITTLLGLFPTAYGFGGFEPFVAPMALALAWGLAFAMPMTLFLIPAAYVIVDDASAWCAKRSSVLKARLLSGRPGNLVK